MKEVSAVELATAVTLTVVDEANIKVSDVGEVILGNVLSAGLGQNVSRQVAIKAGIPEHVPAFSVNKVCASGMKAIELGYQAIVMGNAEVVLCGGCENMNQAPYLLKKARFGLRINDGVLEDSMIRDGLTCSLGQYHMGITAENLAAQYKIDREMQDSFALLSHEKAVKAIRQGEFEAEIVPVTIKAKKDTIDFKVDEHPRADTTLERLAKLKPAFNKEGTVTAGNASGINDGAAAVILASEEFVAKRKLTPLAEIGGFSSAGVSPATMGIGPVPAIRTLVKKLNINLSDIQLFELNEAFAVQSLAVLEELQVDSSLVNVNGGAVALGHPIGASGARIVVTLLHEMQKRKLKVGLASLCVGGGMGMAAVVKR